MRRSSREDRCGFTPQWRVHAPFILKAGCIQRCSLRSAASQRYAAARGGRPPRRRGGRNPRVRPDQRRELGEAQPIRRRDRPDGRRCCAARRVRQRQQHASGLGVVGRKCRRDLGCAVRRQAHAQGQRFDRPGQRHDPIRRRVRERLLGADPELHVERLGRRGERVHRQPDRLRWLGLPAEPGEGRSTTRRRRAARARMPGTCPSCSARSRSRTTCRASMGSSSTARPPRRSSTAPSRSGTTRRSRP